MFERRIKELGIATKLQLYDNDNDMQKNMAILLRQLTFQYLKGELAGIVEDGPEVRELRNNLQRRKELEDFIATQSANGAWATYIELTILAELLGLNFVVDMTGGKKPVVLTAEPNINNPTMLLYNDSNIHWSASNHAGAKQSTLGDGNCGYNAVALTLKKFLDPKSGSEYIVQSVTQHTPALQAAKKEHDRYATAYASCTPEVKEQIQKDYDYSLSLAMQDLPGLRGATQHEVGCLRKLNKDLIEQAIKQQEELLSSFRP